MTKSKGIMGPRIPWTAEQDAELIRRYPDERAALLAADLGRAVGTIYQRAKVLKITKSSAFLASPASGRTNGTLGVATRFSKDSVSWNKGMKGLHYGGEATRFKSGSTPQNRLPVGHIRTNTDGYLEIKTAPGPRKWVGLHRWNWMQAHGAYPARGMTLIFKDGNRLNCGLENLELLTRTELINRNTIHRYPDELKKMIRLSGKLRRKINDHEQH